MPSTRLAYAALVLANLVPLAGAGYLGWSTYDVLLVYWLENGVIGLYALARMATAGRERGAAIETAVKFVFTYGVFWIAHGTLLTTLFRPVRRVVEDPIVGAIAVRSGVFESLPFASQAGWSESGMWAVAGLFVSHGVSFTENWLRGGERRGATPESLVWAPFGRVMLLHVVLIGAGFAVMYLGDPVWALIAMVLLKIVIDVRAHATEHVRAAARAKAVGTALTPDTAGSDP